jgi:hypothetical protein
LGVVNIAADEVDILGGLGDLLTCTTLGYESDDVSLNIHVLEGEPNLLARGVIADTHRRSDVGKGPEAVLGEVEPLFLEVLEFVGSGLPLPVPSSGGFLQNLDSVLVLGV